MSTKIELTKSPPHDFDIEMAVLGAVLLEKHAIEEIIETIVPECFYHEKHQMVYRAAMYLYKDNEPIDILTVTNKLRKMGDLESCGGAYYVSDLATKVNSSDNLIFHARILQEHYLGRMLIQVSSKIIKDGYDKNDYFDVLAFASEQINAIESNLYRQEPTDIKTLVRKTMEDSVAASKISDHITGLRTGISAIDYRTSGLKAPDLIILAARPGMGKTSLAVSIAKNMAVDYNIPVAIFSLEMSKIQITVMLESNLLEIEADKIINGKMNEYDWQHFNKAINPLISSKIFIDDTAALSVLELRVKARKLKAKHNIQIIFVDYLQLMSTGTAERKAANNRELEISYISRSLKALAKELNIPIVALSQLSRSVEQRANKRPMLSDLRESGAIEQDADSVWFLYRPHYYKEYQDEAGNAIPSHYTEMNFAKFRGGEPGEIPLSFIGRYKKFKDYEEFENPVETKIPDEPRNSPFGNRTADNFEEETTLF